MSENITKGAGNPLSFEERVFARFDAMDARFDKVDVRLDALETRVASMEENIGARFAVLDLRIGKLEEMVDARLKETRPIWESVQFELRKLNGKFEQAVEDLFDLRADQKTLRKRVDVIEGITT